MMIILPKFSEKVTIRCSQSYTQARTHIVTTLTITESGFPDLSLNSIVPVIGKYQFMLKNNDNVRRQTTNRICETDNQYKFAQTNKRFTINR